MFLLKVINVFSITSSLRSVWFFLCTNLNPLHWRMLYVCKFANWHWPDGFGEDKNVKSLQTDNRQTDTNTSWLESMNKNQKKGKKWLPFLKWRHIHSSTQIIINKYEFHVKLISLKLEILTRTTKGRGRNSEYNNIFLQLKEYINMWKSIIIFHDHK